MRILLQRVARASVRVGGGEPRAIGSGLVVLLGVGSGDDEALSRRMAEKTVNLRIFSNEAGKFDRSLLDVGGEALVVSQFTLYGDCRKGRRPDFTAAMAPDRAERVYRVFVEELERLGVSARTGEFGAKMEVEIVNDGPVTIWVDSDSGRGGSARTGP
ncbi:MAG: D-aminoacyl-tRNA deacylase [Elusimicrobiota bacterium]